MTAGLAPVLSPPRVQLLLQTAEVDERFADRLIALVSVLGEPLSKNPLKLGRHCHPCVRERWRLAFEDRSSHSLVVGPWNGDWPLIILVQDDSKAPTSTRSSSVMPRTCRGPCIRSCLPAFPASSSSTSCSFDRGIRRRQQFRQTEVEDFDVAVRPQHDVFGFDVTMDEAGRVSPLEDQWRSESRISSASATGTGPRRSRSRRVSPSTNSVTRKCSPS